MSSVATQMSAHNSLTYGPPQPAHFLIRLVSGFTQNSATSCDILALDTLADCSLASMVRKSVRETAACAALGTLACDALSRDLDMTAEANCRQGWFACNRAGNTSSGRCIGWCWHTQKVGRGTSGQFRVDMLGSKRSRSWCRHVRWYELIKL